MKILKTSLENKPMGANLRTENFTALVKDNIYMFILAISLIIALWKYIIFS